MGRTPPMVVIDPIPFSLQFELVASQAHVRPGSSDSADLRELIELAEEIGRPKAAYTTCFVERREGDTVQIDDVSFTSRTLARNLTSVERVFPVVATCGTELDEGFSGHGDLLREYWWDLIKSRLLAAANRHVGRHLRRRFRLSKTASMHPGSGDVSVWPIEQQKLLFTLLGDVDTAIGVRLTDSFLMIPNKTISGLLYPTETDFESCEVCRRENCPSRVAPFNEALWDEIRHEERV